ncbi:hypothetical protein BDV96DRAFT_653442 [Lophiotrema nucula]|uniref:F-box domain-containing protein n=1 Tax=Lophiotrema nucula TaxID=690887 RepID=A0A6A5YKX3_9PLEO|nr:hypothetical protein BDV96DRAFT_653442 [Lophiotrema nucula]
MDSASSTLEQPPNDLSPTPAGAASASFARARFMDLPVELRQKIYYFAMIPFPETLFPTWHYGPSASWCPKYLPPICKTSRTILNEAAPIFLQEAKLVCPGDSREFIQFLGSIPDGKGFRSVRYSRLYRYTSDPIRKSVDLSFERRCSGLQRIGLHLLRSDMFCIQSSTPDTGRRRTATELIAFLELDKLVLECVNLHQVTLYCTNHVWAAVSTDLPKDLASSILKLLPGGHGCKQVEVEVRTCLAIQSYVKNI